ncbi:MAG: hypothetical protein V7776_22285 [Halopseudomonas aestusnigri]
MKKRNPFFVGYFPIPKNLRLFLLTLSITIIAFFAVVGILAGGTQDDPGQGAFRFDYGQQTVIGVIELTPYPILRVTKGNKRIKKGHTLMLTGNGKLSVQNRAVPLNGKLAVASGVILQRGDLDMLQLRGGENGLKAAAGGLPELVTVSLGKWRLAGEICDGKCLAGAMRPNRGLAHKACANLCLIGGIPPVFVSSQPIEGEEFLLITGPNGSPLPELAFDYMAQYISVEAEIIRKGDMLIMQIDPASIKVLS